jgi:hypothetical protein
MFPLLCLQFSKEVPSKQTNRQTKTLLGSLEIELFRENKFKPDFSLEKKVPQWAGKVYKSQSIYVKIEKHFRRDWSM